MFSTDWERMLNMHPNLNWVCPLEGIKITTSYLTQFHPRHRILPNMNLYARHHHHHTQPPHGREVYVRVPVIS